MQRILFGILAAATLASVCGGCAKHAPAARQINVVTADRWKIAADFYEAPSTRRAVIMLHQRGGSASDWSKLAEALREAGISALAIDQRGAGRSTGRKTGSEAPWNTQPDILAAVRWLGARGYPETSIGIAGASYGANNALIYAAHHPIAAVALLSPGANYHGLRIAGLAANVQGQVQVTYATADTIVDGGPAVILRNRADATVRRLDGSAHGTDLLTADSSLTGLLVTFFRNALPSPG